jgi:hypothetical protein
VLANHIKHARSRHDGFALPLPEDAAMNSRQGSLRAGPWVAIVGLSALLACMLACSASITISGNTGGGNFGGGAATPVGKGPLGGDDPTATSVKTGSLVGKNAMAVNKEATFDDCKWVVVAVEDLGDRLRSWQYGAGDATTKTKFIFVRYKVTNLKNQDEKPYLDPKLVDAKGVPCVLYHQELAYLSKKAITRTDALVIPLKPGEEREIVTIFELHPIQAGKLKFEAHDFTLKHPSIPVDLKNPPPPPKTKLIDLPL